MAVGGLYGSILKVMFAVVLAVSLFGCGVDTSTQPNEKVSLPPGSQDAFSKTEFLREYQQHVRETGVSPEVAHCYVEKIKAKPRDFFARIQSMPKEEAAKVLAELNTHTYDDCVPIGTTVLKEDISAQEIEKVRQSLKESLPVLLRSQGASANQIDCMLGQIELMSVREVVAVTSDAGARLILRSMAAHCGASERSR